MGIHAREEKARLAREEEEARLKAIEDEEEAERKRIEEEEERLEAEEEERERREQELEDLRRRVIAEEREKMAAELEAIRKQAEADRAVMEAEREELKQLKLDAIGNGRGRSGGSAKSSPTRTPQGQSGSRPRSATMFGSLFGGSSSRPASAKGFGASAAHDTGAGVDRPASAAQPGSPTKTPMKGNGDGYAADGETDRPRSASFFGSMKTVLASATASVKKGTKALGTAKPKGKFKPFDPETYEYIEREEALRRIQCQIRIKRAYRKIEKRKEQMKADQKKLG